MKIMVSPQVTKARYDTVGANCGSVFYALPTASITNHGISASGQLQVLCSKITQANGHRSWLALDAAQSEKINGRTPRWQDRAAILFRLPIRMEQNLDSEPWRPETQDETANPFRNQCCQSAASVGHFHFLPRIGPKAQEGVSQ